MALTHTATRPLSRLWPILRLRAPSPLTSHPACCRSRSGGPRQLSSGGRGGTGGRVEAGGRGGVPSRHLSLHPALAAASSAAPAASKRADKPLRWQDEAQDWTIHSKGRLLAVTWADGQLSNLHSLWLRYCCHCGQCLEQHTGQRLYLCENLDPHVTLESVAREGDDLVLEFGGGVPHHGRVPLSFLREYDYSTPALLRKKAAVHVNTHAKEVPELTYEAVTQTDDGLYRWLRQLGDYGFCVLKGVPTDDPLTVLKMAEMIGPIQDTIYDDVFDVHVSDHQRTNVAYSADGLVYHQDLLYYESPPGLQFLHTLQFDACVTGGESLIVDMFKVASEFQQAHPTHFHALTSIPATFQKIHYGRSVPVHMTYSRPLITLNADKQIVGVFWEPAHEGPIEVPEHQVEAFYTAHIAFAQAVKNASTQFEWRMEEGDLLAFNNRRVCHSRNAFTLHGGTRHLKGCYVNIDHFKSRLNVLSHQFNAGAPCHRVGNQCMF